MPKFKIEMELTSINERILLTDFDSSENKNNGVTFNENLSEEENGIYNLSFSIAEEFGRKDKINIGSLISVGRPIWLHLYNPNKLVRMVISSFTPVIGPENIIYEIETRDYASYAFARNNAGLTLDTIEDDDFVDWMIQRTLPFPPKIKNIADHILQRGWLQRPNGLEGWTVEVDDWVPNPNPDNIRAKSAISLNFGVSDSNTYNALTELANLSNTFLVFDYINEKVIFLDKESLERDKNYTLRRDFNIQNLGISYSAEELYSIFYVQGGENEFGLATILSEATTYQDNFLFNFNYFKDKNLITENQKTEIENKINIDLASINNSLIDVIREKFTLIGSISELESQISALADTMMLTEGNGYRDLFIQISEIFFRKQIDSDKSVEQNISTPPFTAIWSTLPEGKAGFVFSFPATINYDNNIINVENQNTIIEVDNIEFTISFTSGAESTTTNGYTFFYTPIEGNVRADRLTMLSSRAFFSQTISWDILKPVFPYLFQLDMLDGNASINAARARWQQRVDVIKEAWDEAAAIIASSEDQAVITANETLINQTYRIGIGDYDPETGQLDPNKPGKFTIILSLFDEFDSQYSRLTVPRVLQRYRNLVATKQNFWYDLKKNRQHIFVEGYYDNDIETTPQDLKEQAEAIYLDYQKPLEDFSITYIDVSDLVGINIDFIQPGDFVTLKEDKLKIQQNEISKLKVAQISRVLRDKGNINLTIYRHNMINTIVEKIMARSQ